jgi:uncharacterized membrane protein
MESYLLAKTLHIISAAVLFGTGIGIANFMFFGHTSRTRFRRPHDGESGLLLHSSVGHLSAGERSLAHLAGRFPLE